MNRGRAPGGALLAQPNEQTKIVGAQMAERRHTKRSAQNKSETGKTGGSGERTLWRGPPTGSLISWPWILRRQENLTSPLGHARDAHLLLQELEAKKQLASRKRHAENEERGGNKNLRAAAETKNQNRQHGTTTNQQRTRQITPDQNKSKVQIHRHQNNDDFNP
jgi:hypothetical protein